MGISAVQFFSPDLYFLFFLPLISQTDSSLVQGALERGELIGLTNGTSQNGLMMCIGFIVFSAKAFTQKDYRWLNIIICFIFMCMVFATGKRSYSVITLLVLIIDIWLCSSRTNIQRRITRLIIAAFIFVIIFISAVQFIPELGAAFEKFSSLSKNGNALNGRDELYDMVWVQFLANPFGVGAGAIDEITGAAHNSYLQWLAEYGIFFVWFAFYTILQTPFRQIPSMTNLFREMNDTTLRFYILLAFTMMVLVIVSAFVAVPFQWSNVMMLYMIFQLMFLKQLKLFKDQKLFANFK